MWCGVCGWVSSRRPPVRFGHGRYNILTWQGDLHVSDVALYVRLYVIHACERLPPIKTKGTLTGPGESIINKRGLNLYAGFETCFGRKSRHQRCWGSTALPINTATPPTPPHLYTLHARYGMVEVCEGAPVAGDGMVWYGMVWYGMVWHGMAWYGMAWHGRGL